MHYHAEFYATGHPVNEADIIEETFTHPLDGWALLSCVVADEWEAEHNAAGMESEAAMVKVDSIYQPVYAAICDMGTTGVVIMPASALTGKLPIEYRVRSCDKTECESPVVSTEKVIQLSDWSARFSELHNQALAASRLRHPAGKGRRE